MLSEQFSKSFRYLMEGVGLIIVALLVRNAHGARAGMHLLFREHAADDSCHISIEGEKCHKHVVWAKSVGIRQHPEWYPELTLSSSFEEFQSHLHRKNHHGCPCPLQTMCSCVNRAQASIVIDHKPKEKKKAKPQCTGKNQDPYASGNKVPCCEGLHSCVNKWYGGRRNYFLCKAEECHAYCGLERYNDLKNRFPNMRFAGAGGNGCVYVAADKERGGTQVAIKISKRPEKLKKWADECSFSKQLHDEACKQDGQLLQLAEMYLPVCMEASGTDSAPFMIMHAAAGIGVGKLNSNKLPAETSKSVFAQMVGALMVMHSLGFAHNDLHDGNVQLLDPDRDQIAIVDFGKVKNLEEGRHKERYKRDQDLLPRNAAMLAKCPGDAQFPQYGADKSSEKHEARKRMLLSCLEENWGVDQEFLNAFEAVIDEAYQGKVSTGIPVLFRTAFVQQHHPVLSRMFPAHCKH